MSTQQTLLESYNWSLPQAHGLTTTATFTAGKLHISPCAGANVINGGYTVNEEKKEITFTLGFAMTMMLPAPEVQAIETSVKAIFPPATTVAYNVVKDEVDKSKAVLVLNGTTFKGEMKDELKYASKPVTVFYDIQMPADGVYPENPETAYHTAREVIYNKNDTVKELGEWFVMDGPIKGFKPQDHHTYRLRVLKYRTPTQNFFVYDMTVMKGRA